FRFGVERASDGALDAAETKLPVRDDRRPVVRRMMQDLAAGGTLQIPAVAEPVRAGTARRLSRARAELALSHFRDLMKQEGNDDNLKRAVHETLEWIPQAVTPDGL